MTDPANRDGAPSASAALPPLEGVRVVEFGVILSGPFCGMLLADLGADVIKVENPDGGDPMRAWPPMSNGFSENFLSINRSKRSVVLDLKSSSGLAAARALALSADALVENFRPGVMDKLGLGYAALSAAKPDLVYCSISAFGQTGPRAGEGGFDLTIQAFSGVMSVTGEPDGAPTKCGVPLSDCAAGCYAALAMVSALLGVRAGKPGRHIDVPMLGASLGFAALQTSEYFGTGRLPQALGSAHPRNAPYEAFKAKDTHFALAAGNDSLWNEVCGAMRRPDLAADPRFATIRDRAANQTALKAILEADFARHDAAHWLMLFRQHGVPCAPINSYADVLSDTQVEHMGWVQPVTLPSGVETRTFLSPLRFNGQRAAGFRAPPALGEHTEEVLAELDARIGGHKRHSRHH